MPNVVIIKELFERTKGRTIIINTAELLFDRVQSTTIDEKLPEYLKTMSAQQKTEFENNVRATDHFIELKISV